MDQNQYLSEQKVIGTENNCDAVSSEDWEETDYVFYSEEKELSGTKTL
jgi:hypothetical protein